MDLSRPAAARSGSLAVLLALFLVALAVFLFVGRKSTTRLAFSLALERSIEADAAAKGAGAAPSAPDGKLSFDRGEGFRPQDSLRFAYTEKTLRGEFDRYELELPTRHAVGGVRVDLGRAARDFLIRDVQVSKYLPGRIVLRAEAQDLNRPVPTVEGEEEGGTLRLAAGADPSAVLSSRLTRHTSYLRYLPLVVVLAHAMLWALGGKGRTRADPGRLVDGLRRGAWAGLVVSGSVVVLAKSLALATGPLRFAATRAGPADMASAYASDLFWVALAGLWVHASFRLDGLTSVRVRRGVGTLAATGNACVILAAALFVVFQVGSAYVFHEWGAFLERDDLELIGRSVAVDSVVHYLTRWAGALAALTVGGAAFAVVCLARRVAPPRPRRWIAVGSGLGIALSAFAAPALVDSEAIGRAATTPLLSAFRSQSGVTWDLGARGPGAGGSFALPPGRAVPAQWRDLAGAAAGDDLIVVVLESVRRANVSLYGYERATTPELDAMAERALVFDRAYASQPRSAKTLASLALGIYPDPRLEAISWNAHRVRDRPNLFSRLRRAGYDLYFGITFDQKIDRFGAFIDALWDAPSAAEAPHVVELSDLLRRYGDRAKPGDSIGDDSVLVEDFLAWYADQEGPVVSLLWFAGGHHPYKAAHRPFEAAGTDDLVTGYDNCIYSSDRAIGLLRRELAKSGKRALTLVLGDHGEAFEEHPGDSLHGRYLYDGSVRVPFVIHAPHLIPARRDVPGRFSMKDVPTTLFYLLGLDPELRQSRNIFARRPEDPIYLSTVYGDYKLGLVEDERKWVYWPRRSLSYLFDLERDPGEFVNQIGEVDGDEVLARQRDLLAWYASQIDYVESEFAR